MKLAMRADILALVAASGIFFTSSFQEIPDCAPYPGSGTGLAQPFWVEVDGEVAQRYNNMVTMQSGVIRHAWDNPAGDVRGFGEVRARWQTHAGSDCDPLAAPDEPADTTTTPEPDPEPPDSTASVAPLAQDVYLAGFVLPDTEWARDHGIHVGWRADPEVDYWEVYGGRSDGGGEWGPVQVPGTDSVYRHSLPVGEERANHFGCVVGNIEGAEPSRQQCDDFEWFPMVRSEYEVTVRRGTITAGDSINIALSRVDGGWVDGSVALPDSVVFETGDVRVREQEFPYRFPNDAALFAVPDADSLILRWAVHLSPSGHKSGSVAYPVQ